MIRLKKKSDLEELRISGNVLASILAVLAAEAKAGLALSALDQRARQLLKEFGAKAAFLGYRPGAAEKAYPAAICASVNETIVHGLPGSYILKDGDILKIDFGVDYKGYFTDSAVTVAVGNLGRKAAKLMETTKKALDEAIKVCRPGNHLGDIGFAVESTAKKAGFYVVHGLTGHGVGFELHEDPTILNYGRKGEGLELLTGMVLAIEPMLAIGSSDIRQAKDDSFVTRDGSLSAHFEHTVAITDDGCEILTLI
jgi:methionyl aminopeptidase